MCSPSQRTYRAVALGAVALIQRMLPLVHCLLEYRHGPKDRCDRDGSPKGQDLKGLGSRQPGRRPENKRLEVQTF